MGVYKLSASGGLKTGRTQYTSMLAGNEPFFYSDMQLITTGYGTGSNATITFDNIPQDYKHLQIRFASRVTAATGNFSIFSRFNDDANANYTYHVLYGTGSAVTPGSASSPYTYNYPINSNGSSYAANVHSCGILDILDYSSTVKNKTSRAFQSSIDTSLKLIQMSSTNWLSTAAINKITFTANGNWTSSTRFSLYGVK